MSTKFGPSLLIVALGALSIVIGALGATGTQGQLVTHGVVTVLAAGLLIAVAFGRGWKKFAWGPVLGMGVASVGVAMGFEPVINVGYGLILIMGLWHNYQAERPRRSGAPSNA